MPVLIGATIFTIYYLFIYGLTIDLLLNSTENTKSKIFRNKQIKGWKSAKSE